MSQPKDSIDETMSTQKDDSMSQRMSSLSLLGEDGVKDMSLSPDDFQVEDYEPDQFEGCWGIHSGSGNDSGQLLVLKPDNNVDFKSWSYTNIEQMMGGWNYAKGEKGEENKDLVEIRLTQSRKMKCNELTKGDESFLKGVSWGDNNMEMHMWPDPTFMDTMRCKVVKGSSVARRNGQESVLLRYEMDQEDSTALEFPPGSPDVTKSEEKRVGRFSLRAETRESSVMSTIMDEARSRCGSTEA